MTVRAQESAGLSGPVSVVDGDLEAYTCLNTDGFWMAIEKSLDNGFGQVFVVNQAGVLCGHLTLDRMRAALRDGFHLRQDNISGLASSATGSGTPLIPVLNNDGRLIGIRKNHDTSLLPVAEPDLSHAELRNVLDAFLSTWISSTGEFVLDFETSFAKRAGVEHGVATANGTVSLQLALAALGIGQGDEVIVPDLTFAASANAVIHVGATPVLVDVDPDTWCISVDQILNAITPRTKAVMPVHIFGRPAPMTEICEVARARGLYVIEDCAEAHGALYDNRPVGSFSDIASFSFFANKIITTGEGGMCVTNDPHLAARMKMLRDHGMQPTRRYWHEEPGFNFRMTNLQASIGCAQLRRMDTFLEMRHAVHVAFENALSGLPGVIFPPKMAPRHKPVTWFSCALVEAHQRPKLITACKQANIDLRPFFNSLSAMPAYRAFARPCPVSDDLARRGINLPTSRKVDGDVVSQIGNIFASVLEKSHALATTRSLPTASVDRQDSLIERA